VGVGRIEIAQADGQGVDIDLGTLTIHPRVRARVRSVDTRYWGRALSSLARHSRDKQFLAHVLTSGIRADEEPEAVKKRMFKAYPGLKGQTVPMGDTTYMGWNMDPMEQFFLGGVARLRQPRTIFEIGTFNGATTLLLARSVPTAHVYTLDLPPEDLDPGSAYEAARNKAGSWGARFHNEPEGDRITQLFGDSRKYDFSPYYGKMDLVVVDGGHDADCVTPDTENALRMVSMGGLVIWDDYETGWPSVVRVVDDAARRHGLSLVRIDKTGVCVYDTTKSFGKSDEPAMDGDRLVVQGNSSAGSGVDRRGAMLSQ
jgi:predicted O-methyltransferase YrrM